MEFLLMEFSSLSKKNICYIYQKYDLKIFLRVLYAI